MVTPEHLSLTLNIGLDEENQILRDNTQHVIRTAVHPISRRYRASCVEYYEGHDHVNQNQVETFCGYLGRSIKCIM